MSKAPDPKADKARVMYEEGGYKLIDIANELNIPAGSVRRWKSTYGWKNQSERSDVKCERSVKAVKCSDKVTERSAETKKQAIIEADVKQVLENTELTDKQRLFCVHYIRCFNATKAAIKAGYSKDAAYSIGSENMTKPVVRDEIRRLKQNRFIRELLDEYDIMQKYIDIAFADINDFATIRSGGIETRSDIDGTIVSEISDTANGVKIKLSDRMRALEWLTAHLSMLTEEQRARIAVLKKQAEGNAIEESSTGVIEIIAVMPDEECGDDNV